ncbi:hypothetical protein ACV07N_15720 [Roseivirga echinicomitans]
MENFSTKYELDETLLNDITWVMDNELPNESNELAHVPRFPEMNIVFVSAYER